MTVQVRLGTLLLDFISSLLIGLGVIAAFSPFALYWWIHADYNRYIWIIQGPTHTPTLVADRSTWRWDSGSPAWPCCCSAPAGS
ncbi:hypothetical protein BH24CHL1_BH24CHL1_08640 [soil metagenome]